jgi:hypothetical protein
VSVTELLDRTQLCLLSVTKCPLLTQGLLKALLHYATCLATCLAILLQQALHEVESGSTFRNALLQQKCCET